MNIDDPDQIYHEYDKMHQEFDKTIHKNANTGFGLWAPNNFQFLKAVKDKEIN
jgi:hypothetical protein